MKTPSLLRLGWVLGVALVVAWGVSAFPAPAEAAGITLGKRQGKAGTTLSETVTATGHRTKTFAWTIKKVADPTTLNLVQGDSGTVTYTVTLTKDDGTDRTWIDGKVCITNGGGVATESLMSSLKVTQPPSSATIVNPQQLDVSAKSVLAAGESYCYPYSIEIPDPKSGTYKVTADTTIMNHSGHLGTAFGPGASATTTIPATATLVHNTITVSDTIGGSLGGFSDDGTKTYTHTFNCGNEGNNPNTASVTYDDDDTAGPTASATVTVTCTGGGGGGGGGGGCTRTIGYWKNHPEVLDPLLPVWLGTEGGSKSVQVTTAAQVVTIENIPDANNGIDKLSAQLLAAKLSIDNGADDSAVATTIQAADTFLANNNRYDWDSLSSVDKAQVLSWATTLDKYNNGETGPGHCP